MDPDPIPVKISFKGKLFEVEADPNDSVLAFKTQIFSLTSVPPDRQKLMGLKTGLLSDDTPVSALNLAPGAKLMLIGSVAPSNPPPPPPSSASSSTVFKEDIDRMSKICSRVYLGDEPLKQPGVAVNGPGGSALWVCTACVKNCKRTPIPPSPNPPALPSEFKCQCTDVTSGGVCSFAATTATSMPSDATTTALKAHLAGVVVKQQAMLSEQQARLDAEREKKAKQQMLGRLSMNMRQVMAYEDPELQAMALSLIPLDRVQEDAKTNAKELAPAEGAGPDDAMMAALMKWFKNDFFTWVKNPPCDACGSRHTQAAGRATPTPAERGGQASIVEVYRCTTCGSMTRFPRYNDVRTLLKTRRGRCGEWANTFTLVARAAGFDTRLVLDVTDHVWTEYYSTALKEWVHCDACEPLWHREYVYESGWGKKLSYVIAFSADEVVDVTRRYTRKWAEVASRRNLPEAWFGEQIARANGARAARLLSDPNVSSERREVIRCRWRAEQEQLAKIQRDILAPEELRPRISGNEPPSS